MHALRLPFELLEHCPHHGEAYPISEGTVAGVKLYTCACLVYEANLYRAAAMDGAVDPRWLSPDDWYAAELERTKDNAPA